jgi:hypothetical protein
MKRLSFRMTETEYEKVKTYCDRLQISMNDLIRQLIREWQPEIPIEQKTDASSNVTFRIRAGIWSRYFLNKQACQHRTAFYQYGTLPKFLLSAIASIWQQHEGAARIILWLLFKTKMGNEKAAPTDAKKTNQKSPQICLPIKF